MYKTGSPNLQSLSPATPLLGEGKRTSYIALKIILGIGGSFLLAGGGAVTAYFLTQSLLQAAIAGGATLLLAGAGIGTLLWISNPRNPRNPRQPQTTSASTPTPFGHALNLEQFSCDTSEGKQEVRDYLDRLDLTMVPKIQEQLKLLVVVEMALTITIDHYYQSKLGERELPLIEYRQRQLLSDPENEKMIYHFAQELSRVHDEKTLVRIYIKFFDQELVGKIHDQLPKNADFYLWQLVDSYRNSTNDLAVVRARLCLGEIKGQLSKGDIIGTAIDNGDCYFDTFAQGTNRFFTKPVTAKQLRMDVHEFCQNSENEEWLKGHLKGDAATSSYEDYRDRIQYTYEECREMGTYPVWANSHIVGAILSEKYGVNIILHEAIENGADDVKKLTVYESEPATYPVGAPHAETIKIASYGDHFFPIFSS